MVGILIFVYQQIIKTLLILGAHFFAFLQQPYRQYQQIVKIHRVIDQQFILITFIYLRHFLIVKIRSSFTEITDALQLVFGIGNTRRDTCRLKTLFIQIQFF